MNDTEYKSIKEISLEIGVVKQTIRNYINIEPLKSKLQPYIKHIGNRILIHSNGVKLIILFNEKGNLADLGDFDDFVVNSKGNFANLDGLGDDVGEDLGDFDDFADSSKSDFADLDDKKPKENTKHPSTSLLVDDMTMNYINSLKEQISILTADKEHDRAQILDYQEELKKQSGRIADLAEKLVELTRNSQVLLKQEQDKSTYLLPEQKEKRPFWQFWKK